VAIISMAQQRRPKVSVHIEFDLPAFMAHSADASTTGAPGIFLTNFSSIPFINPI
jgi:hypothetical protein